jgi:hypothetical protein
MTGLYCFADRGDMKPQVVRTGAEFAIHLPFSLAAGVVAFTLARPASFSRATLTQR